MIFTRRHEQELAEIHLLTYELDQRVQEGLEQLERIREAQDRLAGRTSTPTARSTGTAAPPSEHPLLAFVHIPKTAGATVRTMFAAAYSRHEVRDAGNYLRNPERAARTVARPRKMGGRVLAGHVPYGVFREPQASDTRYMTFLREPVDRVLSHFYRHILRKNPNNPKEGRKIRVDSLEEGLVERRLPELSNLATRFLCTDPSPRDELPASALDDAKENLRSFAFIGIQERFEESLVLLQRMLGLGLVPYRDRHVSADRPSVEEISDEQRALIAEYNRLDAELYSFGMGLFEDAVAAADDGFAADVEALRARSGADREEEWHTAVFGS